ncbi:hypothetical protein ANO11243_097600 [Dothideomycetidae sp. 11243]|nr:hypothetical protein ANO11243_097600 [fungal sp. No.11243]
MSPISALQHDSCGSVRVGSRALWVCRDTRQYDGSTATVHGAIVPNSASWTDFDKAGNPSIIHDAPRGAGSTGSNSVLLMYGGSYNPSDAEPFYPVPVNECPTRGFCSGGTRYAIWPGQPPMIASATDSQAVLAYTWIRQNHEEKLQPVAADQPTTLYKVEYNLAAQTSDLAPNTTTVNAAFWQSGEWGFGAYGSLVYDNVAYLYGQNEDRTAVALAKVDTDGVEDRSKYLYYVDGEWISTLPSLANPSVSIDNLGLGRQGTFYFSEAFECFIWIGEYENDSNTTMNFKITTAPAPEGPWIEPYTIYSAPLGNGTFGGYSIQAHPSLVRDSPTNRSIYLSFTQQWSQDTFGGSYVTPLIYLQLQ